MFYLQLYLYIIWFLYVYFFKNNINYHNQLYKSKKIYKKNENDSLFYNKHVTISNQSHPDKSTTGLYQTEPLNSET